MIKNFIKLYNAHSDLPHNEEDESQGLYWRGQTYASRLKEINRCLSGHMSGIPPRLEPLRVISFHAPQSVSMARLRELARRIQEQHPIECIQITKNIYTGTVCMLFDWLDRSSYTSYRLHSTREMKLTAMIYNFFGEFLTVDESRQLYHLLNDEYVKAKDIFDKVSDWVDSMHPTNQTRRILHYSLMYAKSKCLEANYN